MKEFEGLLDPEKMSVIERKGYQSWTGQRCRCYDKNHPAFKNYGANGIEVRYSSRQFLGWWVEQMKTFVGKIPTVGRIDHDGHYEFGNIVLQDKADNTREVLARRGSPRSKQIKVYRDGILLGEWPKIKAAAAALKRSRCTLRRSLRDKVPTQCGMMVEIA